MDKERRVVWFEEVGKEDLPQVGGKGANLGEMIRAGIPVPPGFIVTAQSYFYFLEKSSLTDTIRKLLSDLDPNDSEKLQKTASRIMRFLNAAVMPKEVARKIAQSYGKLGSGAVAVRSSATAEDLPEASFAGQQRTFLNVTGESDVVTAVQGCWASLFEPRAIFYRANQGFDHFSVGIAVPIQRMVQSEASGVMFTIDPITNDRSKIVIEAVYGLGEAIVSGEVTPDLYVVDKKELEIIDKKIARQEWQLVRNAKGGKDFENANIKVDILEAEQAKQKFSDEDIVALAKIGKRIEDHYDFPQDIEWAKEGEDLFIVQTRPVTTIRETTEQKGETGTVETLLLSGSPASPGMASGPSRIIYRPSEIDRVLEGNVLVAEMTTPDYVPAMKRAAAIVTDRGGRTCHAAIVSRELGLPCVVGTENATKVLKQEQIITVDGSTGNVFDGRLVTEKTTTPTFEPRIRVRTNTKVYVNLAEPELAEKVASRHVNGVGLLRAEFIIAQIGEHPRHMISQGRGEEFVERLTEGVTTFAKAFKPRPVVYRTTDFKTNEYRNLKGGEQYEDIEENPMLGYRGCSRYVQEADLFKMEIEMVKRVREDYKNLWIMIPFVRTVKEMAHLMSTLKDEGLSSSKDFKIWMMVEVPSNIFLIDEFIDVGIDGISIGSNDLTQLILGIDRDSPKLADIFDERNEAVMLALKKAIKAAARRGITVSICGQAPSVYPELTEKLVKWGITSISVSPDAIESTREIIAKAEGRMVSPSLWRRKARNPHKLYQPANTKSAPRER
ncbi:MAG TPA: phosphoenolpyruvate synthase [Dehalococcoidia bacterium]|nr:phosphoenolpyruvate synthase [Dehalococcoidia bacterium]